MTAFLSRSKAVVVGLTAVSVLACDPSRPSLESAPDVVLITVDTLRADHLGSYGFDLDTSPSIDALAEGGVVFERAIAASSRTVPSHASILTARFVREHSIGHANGHTRLSDEATLAAAFLAAGYRTAAFVGNAMLRRRVGLHRGFEVYDDELPDAERNRPLVFERVAERTTRQALRWLERVQGRFFLWVHYQDPHGPYTPPAPYDRQFRVDPPPGEQPLPTLPGQRGQGGIPAYQALPGMRFPHQYQSQYLGEIRYFDASLGKLLDAIDEKSRQSGVVVLLTSDHGESLGEDDRYFVHGFETTPEQSRVALVLSAPGLPPQRRRELVHHVDVAPTLLDLAGLEALPNARGIALGPALRSQQPIPDRVLYSDVGEQVSAYSGESFVRVRMERARDPARSGTWETFTWDTDGSWNRVAARSDLEEEISHYIDSAKPLNWAIPLDDEDRLRLQALGYIEPTADP